MNKYNNQLSNTILLNNKDKMQLIALRNDYEKYIHAAVSDNTRTAYKSDLKQFIDFGGTIPSTPEIISNYLAMHANSHKPATLARWLVSINKAHSSQNLLSPMNSDLVKATLRGIKRIVGTQQRQVAPVLKNNLIEMVADLTGIKGLRDRALLLLGFAGALRRSELVGLIYSDVEFVEQGLVIHLRRSKTDQLGEGRKVAIPFARGSVCAVLSLKRWLEISGINDGPLFRPITRHGRIENTALSTQAVAVIVKERASAIDLDAKKFSGHSLRAGLVTSAAQAGVSAWKIKQQTGHKNDSILSRYIRDARLFVDNAAGAVL